MTAQSASREELAMAICGADGLVCECQDGARIVCPEAVKQADFVLALLAAERARIFRLACHVIRTKAPDAMLAAHTDWLLACVKNAARIEDERCCAAEQKDAAP